MNTLMIDHMAMQNAPIWSTSIPEVEPLLTLSSSRRGSVHIVKHMYVLKQSLDPYPLCDIGYFQFPPLIDSV